MSPAVKQVWACMALPGPWFVQPAMVGCHSCWYANRVFSWPTDCHPKRHSTSPPWALESAGPAPQADVRTSSRGEMAEILVAVASTNHRTNTEMCICPHHGCWCNHGSYLLCAFSELVHAKVTALLFSGLEHKKTAILHQMSFVFIFLFFVFSLPQSLITGTEVKSAHGCILTPTDLEWDCTVGPKTRGFALVLLFSLKKKN